jgi:hypothetical protein
MPLNIQKKGQTANDFNKATNKILSQSKHFFAYLDSKNALKILPASTIQALAF